MKIQYCSDIHLEFKSNREFMLENALWPVGEILILAGDILPLCETEKYSDFISYAADKYEAVYWIPGNHEYYRYNLGGVASPLHEKIRSNVFLVNDIVIPYKDVNLVCSTLWSRISPEKEWLIQHGVTDFHQIRWGEERLRAHRFNQLHENSVAFLDDAFRVYAGQKNIVVTHHVPTLYKFPQPFLSSPFREAFGVELFNLIEASNALYWIYGHHPCPVAPFTVGNTTLITNQLGYVRENQHRWYNPKAIVEV
jgi:DNA repair exonuclease SbcCD nuclease subunit